MTVPTVVASGDSQFNRQQDQTNASLLSLGGGTRRGNNYLVDGVPITDMRNRASANPSIEALEDVNVQVHTYDAETGRTGGGTFNVGRQVGHEQLARQRLLPEPAEMGRRRTTSSPSAPGSRSRIPTSTWAAAPSAGRSSGTARSSGRRSRATARTRPATARTALPTEPRAQRRLLADVHQHRSARRDLRPADRRRAAATAASRSRATSFRRTGSTRCRARCQGYLPTADRRVSNGSEQLRPHGGNQRPRDHVHGQGRSPLQRQRLADRLLPLQQDATSRAPTTGSPGLSGANRFIDRGDYMLLRRVNVLALNNTWLPSNNTVVTLRYGWTQFIDDDTLSIDFDPASLGFSSSVPEHDPGRQIPARVTITTTDYYACRARSTRPTGIGTRGAPTATMTRAARTAHPEGWRRLADHRHQDSSRSRAAPATSGSIGCSRRRTRRHRRGRQRLSRASCSAIRQATPAT